MSDKNPSVIICQPARLAEFERLLRVSLKAECKARAKGVNPYEVVKSGSIGAK